MTPRPGGAYVCGGYVLGAMLIAQAVAPLMGPSVSYVRCARVIAVLGLRPETWANSEPAQSGLTGAGMFAARLVPGLIGLFKVAGAIARHAA